MMLRLAPGQVLLTLPCLPRVLAQHPTTSQVPRWVTLNSLVHGLLVRHLTAFRVPRWVTLNSLVHGLLARYPTAS